MPVKYLCALTVFGRKSCEGLVEDRLEAMAIIGEKCEVFFRLQRFLCHMIKQEDITRSEVIHEGPQVLTFCAVRV
jgi:hypothetical protein